MQKIALSAGFYASNYAIERPKLDWTLMREKLGEILKWYNDFVEENPETQLKKLAVSMEATAERILYLFNQKFKKGKIENFTLKLTRSYLAAAIGKNRRAPSEITISRHIDRFLEMPNSFIKLKQRSVMALADRECNCISLQIDPKLIVYTDEKHNKSHDFVLQNTRTTSAGIVNITPKTPRPTSKPVAYAENPSPLQSSHNPYKKPEAEPIAPKTASSVGNLMADFFKNFDAPS